MSSLSQHSKKNIVLQPEQLKQIAPGISNMAVNTFLPYINKYAPIYNVDTLQRLSAYLAQVLHESGNLRYVQEIWGPTMQQLKYERDRKYPWHNRLSPKDKNYLAYQLGNEYEGDGKFFKGHGLIQITGRTNHKQCSLGMFNDERLLKNPALLTVPEYAVWSSFWFWQWKDMNRLADTPGIYDDTKRVNGGLNGIHQRLAYYKRSMDVLA